MHKIEGKKHWNEKLKRNKTRCPQQKPTPLIVGSPLTSPMHEVNYSIHTHRSKITDCTVERTVIFVGAQTQAQEEGSAAHRDAQPYGSQTQHHDHKTCACHSTIDGYGEFSNNTPEPIPLPSLKMREGIKNAPEYQ